MVVPTFCIWNWCHVPKCVAVNEKIQMMVRMSPSVNFKEQLSRSMLAFLWQPAWKEGGNAPRSKAQSGATYKSRLLPEKVPTVPSKDMGNVPKVPVGTAYTLLVWVSYPEIRYTQRKSFNVMDINDVVMQIINISNKQLCFYILCSYIVSVPQQKLDHRLSAVSISSATCRWCPSTIQKTWNILHFQMWQSYLNNNTEWSKCKH
jgi:hypothetical protein